MCFTFLVKCFITNSVCVFLIVALIRFFTRVPANCIYCVRVFANMYVCILLKLRVHTGSVDRYMNVLKGPWITQPDFTLLHAANKKQGRNICVYTCV